jgi:hypothetical protein
LAFLILNLGRRGGKSKVLSFELITENSQLKTQNFPNSSPFEIFDFLIDNFPFPTSLL